MAHYKIKTRGESMDEKKIKVLVVEDETSIRRFITLNLEMADFDVWEAESGEKALERILISQVDVVVLDLMLPGIDGLEVCRQVRNITPESLIIMLTAKSQDIDKIIGLELGADDYMIKPFNPYELIARIKAMVRRRDQWKADESEYVCGELYLDITANKLIKRDTEIELTPTEYALLKLFMENPDKALKRDEMLDAVWGPGYFGDTKTLDVHIRRLREKIEDDSSEPLYIKTVWGTGYRWQSQSGGRHP